MEKQTRQLPVYEKQEVQVGTRDIDVWVTSDGQEFYHDWQAAQHEYRLEVKQKEISLPYDASLYYFENKEQVVKAIEKLGSYATQQFDEETYSYPNWFVMYCTGQSDDHEDYQTYYDMKYFDDFKVYVNELLENAMK